jgi:DNA gyrase/topoisomerase IV subunit A
MSEKMTDESFINEFNLTSSKHLGVNNLHLFTIKGNIKKYENISHILKEWASVRLIYYKKRVDYQLKTMEEEYLILSAKIRFIIDVIEGKVLIMNKKMKDVEEQLEKLEYYKYENSFSFFEILPMYPINNEILKELKHYKYEFDNGLPKKINGKYVVLI